MAEEFESDRGQKCDMKCHLCLQDRKLCDSHVVPEFLYRPGYDSKHRMEVLEQAAPRARIIQKGLREKLLCQDCENLLANNYENYFSRLWYQERILPVTTKDAYWHLSYLDYTRFKLFHLSILWRSGVSTLKPFAKVTLGPTGDILRKMLLNQDPGTEHDFQIFGVLVLYPGSDKVLDGLIGSPTYQFRDAHPLYIFVFGGCVWHYYECLGEPNPVFSQIALSRHGTMTLPVRSLDNVSLLDGFFREYARDHDE